MIRESSHYGGLIGLVRRLALLVSLLLFAGAVGLVGGVAGASAGRDSTPPRGSSSLDDVDVSGNVGEKPTLHFDAPFIATRTVRRVLVHGSGTSVARGDKVTIDYVAVDGRGPSSPRRTATGH